jgi:hypothetical protein
MPASFRRDMNLSAGGQELQPSEVKSSNRATRFGGLTAVSTCEVSAIDCKANSRKQATLVDLIIKPVTTPIRRNSRERDAAITQLITQIRVALKESLTFQELKSAVLHVSNGVDRKPI